MIRKCSCNLSATPQTAVGVCHQAVDLCSYRLQCPVLCDLSCGRIRRDHWYLRGYAYESLMYGAEHSRPLIVGQCVKLRDDDKNQGNVTPQDLLFEKGAFCQAKRRYCAHE